MTGPSLQTTVTLEYTLGALVRKVRQEQGIGLRVLATRCGISPSYLSRIETGAERSPPSEDVLEEFARHLDIDVDRLLCLAGRVPADLAEWATSSVAVMKRLRMEAKRTPRSND